MPFVRKCVCSVHITLPILSVREGWTMSFRHLVLIGNRTAGLYACAASTHTRSVELDLSLLSPRDFPTEYG